MIGRTKAHPEALTSLAERPELRAVESALATLARERADAEAGLARARERAATADTRAMAAAVEARLGHGTNLVEAARAEVAQTRAAVADAERLVAELDQQAAGLRDRQVTAQEAARRDIAAAWWSQYRRALVSLDEALAKSTSAAEELSRLDDYLDGQFPETIGGPPELYRPVARYCPEVLRSRGWRDLPARWREWRTALVADGLRLDEAR